MSDTTTVDNDLLDRHAPQIGPAPVALYLLLRRLATQEGDSLVVVGYSHQEFADRLNMSRRHVIRLLNVLKKNGMIRTPTGQGKRAEYSFTK